MSISSRLSPITLRRLAAFKANRRARISLWLFGVLFILSLFAELIANDKPLILHYDGQWYAPLLVDYPETEFGGFLPLEQIIWILLFSSRLTRMAGRYGRLSPSPIKRWICR